jgi:DNA-binding GntR family transcriptional regulator
LAEVDFSRDWLVDTLERRYGVRAARQERWLEPILPAARDLRHLGLTAPAACLLVDERNLAADGTPISFVRIVARGDRCRAYFQLETR